MSRTSVSSKISCAKLGDCLMTIGRRLYLNCPKRVRIIQRSLDSLLISKLQYCMEMSSFVKNLYPFRWRRMFMVWGNGYILRLISLLSSQNSETQDPSIVFLRYDDGLSRFRFVLLSDFFSNVCMNNKMFVDHVSVLAFMFAARYFSFQVVISR